MSTRRAPDLTPLQLARFWTQVTRKSNGGCWLWTGYIDPKGYGRIGIDDQNWQAHVLAYALVYGPIAEDLTHDHVCHTADPTCPRGPACRHRRCVNPNHIEIVPLSVNVQRGRAVDVDRAAGRTHCPHGHELNDANTYVRPSGFRDCRACNRVRGRRLYYERVGT